MQKNKIKVSISKEKKLVSRQCLIFFSARNVIAKDPATLLDLQKSKYMSSIGLQT